jgi:superfamily II DNA or RNA helicase
MFRKLTLKANYSSEHDNLYEDFFLPVLSEATVYRRAVGFFSLGVLLNTPAAMTRIIETNGRIELIFGKLVAAQDFEALRDGLRNPWEGEDFPSFEKILDEHRGSLLAFRIRLLAWLFAAGRMEIKVAIRPLGMFHQKIGLLEDRFGDHLSFSGSMNETMSALDPRFNSEEISVFKSWNAGQAEYVDGHRQNFERLWSGDTGSATIISTLPDAIGAGLKLVSNQFPDKPTAGEEDAAARTFFQKHGLGGPAPKPSVPKTFGGQPFKMRDHQLAALKAWSENKYNGILELATGAGKTITAIYAATRTVEQNDGMVLIVAVPYQDLADQWCEELRVFNISALRCYGSRGDWEPQLRAYLARNRDQQREFLAIVVVNRTLQTEHFQDAAGQLDRSRMFFIGDECHHHGSEGFAASIFPGAQFRIGLSATPFHYLDDERNLRLREIYDQSVYQYTLADAVKDAVLTPYEYRPTVVELTHDETLEYIDLSEQISRVFAAAQAKNSTGSKLKLTALLMRRARLIGAAANKLPALEKLLNAQSKIDPFSLFYCSDGRTLIDADSGQDAGSEDEILVKQRHAVARLLQKQGVRVSPFTSDENRWQRREILARFKSGETEALVAIRCLDEGIDVPACRTAYLIASSRNPRQFVQRRGRILRRSEGKEFARIFDFVVVLPENAISTDQLAGDFLRNELSRVADFARNSLYPASSIEPLMPWLKRYGLEHLAA